MNSPVVREYIFFERDELYKGKTQRWVVRNRRSGASLAVVAWSGAWRQYVFKVNDTEWSTGCLSDVLEFLVDLNSERHCAARLERHRRRRERELRDAEEYGPETGGDA